MLLLLAWSAQAADLNWHTDLEAAKREAKAGKRLILSLHLLGRFDEELSCANSRFFKSLLYPHREVSRFMRENFVLHWKSVRPVPKVTVDFGDGRVLRTTITGNSLHYVLDEEGRPLDALPGLYSPKRFLRGLESALGARAKGYHAGRLRELRKEWARIPSRPKGNLPLPLFPDRPNARSAGSIAITKSVSQMNLVRALTPETERNALRSLREHAVWKRLAEAGLKEVAFDEGALAVIRKQLPDRPLEPLLETLKRTVAEDSAWNEYYFHAHLHAWLAESPYPPALEELNARVYRELFLSPPEDPWMGLHDPNVYSALTNNGFGR